MRSSRWITTFLAAALCCGTYGLKVMTVGDWGDNSSGGRARQEQTAQAMSVFCVSNPCDFILSLGDNFYNDGVTSVDDVRFNDSWRWVYNKTAISDLDWYQSLGNHDYGSTSVQPENRELNQIAFSQVEPRWKLPWLWYDFYVQDEEEDFTVHFIVVDSMSILLRKYEWEYELDWYRQTLATSTGHWKFVVIHHPPYSVGNYGAVDTTIRNALVPAAEEFGVDILISGHDHNLQHIVKRGVPDIDYVISGGGGRALYQFQPAKNSTLSNLGLDVPYFGYHLGFVWFDISSQTMTADFWDENGNKPYTFTRRK